MAAPSQIAHYRISAKIGEGGMGAVYRATDTKLNRDVAVKVLPGIFASDPDRLARFTREAQVLASLNHPNIAAIYGVEDRALVMELVEGATLADRITQGPMPFDEALPLIRQLIDALDCAHQKGVIHRDLKPANIKITHWRDREGRKDGDGSRRPWLSHQSEQSVGAGIQGRHAEARSGGARRRRCARVDLRAGGGAAGEGRSAMKTSTARTRISTAPERGCDEPPYLSQAAIRRLYRSLTV